MSRENFTKNSLKTLSCVEIEEIIKDAIREKIGDIYDVRIKSIDFSKLAPYSGAEVHLSLLKDLSKTKSK